MTGWILKLILIALVIRAVVKFARGIYAGLRDAVSVPPAVPLVRDPVCGTFVVPTTALSIGTGAQSRYFCSENCRRVYQAKRP